MPHDNLVTHADYLYLLPHITADLLSPEQIDPEHVKAARDHLRGWRTCQGCQKERDERQFPQGEFEMMHFREEQLSPPERARLITPFDFLGFFVEQKQRRGD